MSHVESRKRRYPNNKTKSILMFNYCSTVKLELVLIKPLNSSNFSIIQKTELNNILI